MTRINDYNLRLEQAEQCYLDRQARDTHPSGSFDNGGRWYPDEDEIQECCNSIRRPSRNYPYSLMVHCRTIKHIANLYNVEVRAIRTIVRNIMAAEADP